MRSITYVAKLGSGSVSALAFRGLVTRTAFSTQPLAVTPAGEAVVDMIGNRTPATTLLVQADPLLRVRLQGEQGPDTLMLSDVRNRTHEVRFGDGGAMGRHLMSDATLWALSRNGQFAARVDRTDDASQRLQPPTLTLSGTDGCVIYRQQLPHPGQRTSRSDVDALVARHLLELNAGIAAKAPSMPRMTDAMYRPGMFVPTYRISVVDLVLGDDGTVLIRGNDRAGDAVAHTWFNPDGSIRGTFSVPRSQVVRAVRDHHIWSLATRYDGEVRLIKQSVGR